VQRSRRRIGGQGTRAGNRIDDRAERDVRAEFFVDRFLRLFDRADTDADAAVDGKPGNETLGAIAGGCRKQRYVRQRDRSGLCRTHARKKFLA
jgi:hypothetical protein